MRQLLLTFCWCLLLPQACSADSIASVNIKTASTASKIDDLKKLKSTNNGFIFFTDTHVGANDLGSQELLKLALDATGINRVIWGGDAISAFGTKNALDSQWTKQCDLAQSVLDRGANFYNVRGNHDLTIRTSRTVSFGGFTYSQEETFKKMSNCMSTDVVRNAHDPYGLYYFFDDPGNRIRYIVLETNDRTEAGNISGGTLSGVRKTQLLWIINNAILKIPSGYGIVFISHVPISDTTGSSWKVYEQLYDVIAALAKKEKIVVFEKRYDFSQLDNVDVLMVISGHHHHDMQTYQNGVLHVTTASDAQYNDFSRDPFSIVEVDRNVFKLPCVDVFSIDAEHKMIKTVRLGIGGNRSFYLKPILLQKGNKIKLETSLTGSVKWFTYNAWGNVYLKGKWTLYDDVISVTRDGLVLGLRKGEAVVFSQDSRGNREIYNVIVE